MAGYHQANRKPLSAWECADNGWQNGIWVAEPIMAGKAEHAANLGDEADVGRIEKKPNVGDGDHRQNCRRKVRHANQ